MCMPAYIHRLVRISAGIIRLGSLSQRVSSGAPTVACRKRFTSPYWGTNSTLNSTPTNTCPTKFGEKNASRKNSRPLTQREFSRIASPSPSGICSASDQTV